MQTRLGARLCIQSCHVVQVSEDYSLVPRLYCLACSETIRVQKKLEKKGGQYVEPGNKAREVRSARLCIQSCPHVCAGDGEQECQR